MARDMTSVSRRGLMAVAAALTVRPLTSASAAIPPLPTRMLSAASFGAVGDGHADDTAALQAALDATMREGGTLLTIPPGTYRVSRTLRLVATRGTVGDIGRHNGILAHGARLASAIIDGSNILEIDSRTTLRFLLIEGLDVLGNGREKHGLVVACNSNSDYLYNFCLRDTVVQHCGGDGLRLVGNVFEGQIIDSYFRNNLGRGATFAHGQHGGILSAVHVFGTVFGENAGEGAALVNGCYDVAFHGCYFVLNGKAGLAAANGCTLLSNSGFENNHARARDFAAGGPGIALQSFGTLVGCTGYSVFHQTALIDAFVTSELVLVGCTGSGGSAAKAAGLARLRGAETGTAIALGCSGPILCEGGFEALEIGGGDGGIRFGSHWQSRILPRLGDYRLWVDASGRLRLKRGAPSSDKDGVALGPIQD